MGQRFVQSFYQRDQLVTGRDAFWLGFSGQGRVGGGVAGLLEGAYLENIHNQGVQPQIKQLWQWTFFSIAWKGCARKKREGEKDIKKDKY